MISSRRTVENCHRLKVSALLTVVVMVSSEEKDLDLWRSRCTTKRQDF